MTTPSERKAYELAASIAEAMNAPDVAAVIRALPEPKK